MSSKAFTNELDRNKLLELLLEYFQLSERNTYNSDELSILVKTELSKLETMRKLIIFTGYGTEEFFYHIIALYPHLFNRSFLRKVKSNVVAANLT